MATAAPLTNVLTARLRHTFSTAQIADWANSLAHMQAMGLKIDDVFPQGIPVPDILVMKTQIPVDDIGAVLLKLHQQVPVRRLEIFPLGIPTQDMWRLRVSVAQK